MRIFYLLAILHAMAIAMLTLFHCADHFTHYNLHTVYTVASHRA